MMPDFILRATQSAFESGIVERLQQIIERARFKSSKSVLVVSGNENHGRRHIAAQHFENIESVASGHLHVEENQVRLCSANFGERLQPGSRLSHNLDLRMAL